MGASFISIADPSIYLSLAFLFGIAAQFRAMDGNSFLRRVLASVELKTGVLFAVALVTFVVSPFLLNDVLVLILTPAVIKYAKQYGLDPIPLIVAEITFTNISSSLTPIGNPQNILLWTATGISFERFVQGTWMYVLASGAIAAVALLPLALRYRGKPADEPTPSTFAPAYYLAFVTLVVIGADLVALPSYVSLGIAFVGGFALTGRKLTTLLMEFDFRALLTLYVFVAATTVAAYFLTPYILGWVSPAASGVQPYSGLFVGLASNFISNVPATQLLINTAGVSASVAPKIAAEAGIAGNLGPIASFANLLAIQMASKAGIRLRKLIALQILVGVLAFVPVLF
ncbi:MAG: hypothetical protein JRM74_05270 [Nitrososphaerota archaeon]|nr:hypothetical protein [Nitrososphaerota archaeon]